MAQIGFEELPVILAGTEDYEIVLQERNRIKGSLLEPIENAAAARTQEAYDRHFDEVFLALQELDEFFSDHGFLTGNRPSGADILLYSVLVRFDSIYYFAYWLNLHHLRDYKNLFRYMKKLYGRQEFRAVTNLKKIKENFYKAQSRENNPYGLIPPGPDFSEWDIREERN